MSQSDLARLLAGTDGPLLLDFDGPVCQVFAGLPAHEVAVRLRAVITTHGTALPSELDAGGPHELLRFAGSVSLDLACSIDATLRTDEVAAAATAEPTPGAIELLQACQEVGVPVAIVSNNAGEAVQAYLERMKLSGLVAHIEGRDHTDPVLMKPNPRLITRTLDKMNADPRASILVGDSASDVEAAHAAGVLCIGYANKPGKTDRLVGTDVDVLVTSMTQIASALRDGAQSSTAPR